MYTICFQIHLKEKTLQKNRRRIDIYLFSNFIHNTVFIPAPVRSNKRFLQHQAKCKLTPLIAFDVRSIIFRLPLTWLIILLGKWFLSNQNQFNFARAPRGRLPFIL